MSLTTPKILFYVQHLLGIGHVKRASLLVDAWVKFGFEVIVVSGGEAVVGFDFPGAKQVQLPAIKAADASFSGLVDKHDEPLTEAFKVDRKQRLLEAYNHFQPDILVLENYPFGRRQLRWELDPLLQLSHSQHCRPMIVASVRDILQARKESRRQETLEKLANYFDCVMVHGDPDFIPLSSSFPEASSIRSQICYSGYVCQSIETRGTEGTVPLGNDEVIVSAGGGAVGYQLMVAALEARTNSIAADATWRFLVGPNLPKAQLQQLQKQVGSGVIIESVRPDFPQLLENCRLSISQAGYNTVMDILVAGCASVLVPFVCSGETEQMTRTRRLHQLGLCTMLEERELSGKSMATAIESALKIGDGERYREGQPAIDLNGAEQSAQQLLEQWHKFNISQKT
ncbi:MAG: glycosyltransferase [Motiliproteus sp.]|nr:glycosyltransferase [Motiliproteus sp.]MCW9051953.1 glycosyltransferase [Motiliproteus sp.]